MKISRRVDAVKAEKRAIVLLLSLVLFSTACGVPGELFDASGPPRNAVVVEVVANSSLRPWLETAISRFNEAGAETQSGQPIYVTLELIESGQAIVSMTSSGALPALWIPDDPVWTEILAEKGVPEFVEDCQSVAESPLVIAMWKPIAEALGWPGRDLGWLDVGSLAADPSAWDYYSGGQYGDNLRLGHTHPGLSASGAGTLLAVVQAAQSKTDAVGADEVQLPIVQASVGAFEAAVSWFSSNTDTLGQTMSQRGIQFLGAAIVYESTVFEHGGGDPEIVPIYPFEGTFMATHPACMNSLLADDLREATRIFRAYLLGEEGQQMSLDFGFRPVLLEIPAGSRLSERTGIDLSQPDSIFDAPSVDTVYAAQSLWQSARKDVNLVMLIDVSGSMRGSKLANVQSAAVQFLEQMGEDDYISIIAFSQDPFILIHHELVGDARGKAIDVIQELNAGGNTPLYDAIGDGAALIDNTTASQVSNAMVVLTDGMDTGSRRYRFNQSLIDLAAANNTTVFTIAYGEDADEIILEELAIRANGNFYLGDEASIAMIYEEMSAAFGGSVGVGR
ncbi:MAG: solute-binding protein [Anaerolineales bacterium]|nr:solute-binding protein [Anaerolineales bacterium]